MRARRSWLLVVLAASAVLAGRNAGRWLVRDDPLPERADAIVVMAGSVPDRVLEAADLYRDGRAPRVVITRERSPSPAAALRRRGVYFPASDEQAIGALLQLGVPRAAIVSLRRPNYSTETEARTLARWACRRGLHRLVVVTSASHTARAGMILRAALGDGVDVRMRASRYDPFPADHWWRVRHAAKRVLSEYQKLANYWLRQRWRIAPCGGLRGVRRRPPV